jgi:hypothetical protein
VRNIARGRYGRDVRVLNGVVDSLMYDGVLIAEPAVVAADCARLLPARDALICADALLHERRLDLDELHRHAVESTGTHGASRIRWIATHADPAAESPGETWSRTVLRDLGFAPRSQVTVGDEVTALRVDFLLGSVAIEFDGSVKYREPEGTTTVGKVLAEKERRALLQSLGFTVLEIIWRQLHDPARLLARLQWAGAQPQGTALHLPQGWSLLRPESRAL